jgi:hypothetical protein
MHYASGCDYPYVVAGSTPNEPGVGMHNLKGLPTKIKNAASKFTDIMKKHFRKTLPILILASPLFSLFELTNLAILWGGVLGVVTWLDGRQTNQESADRERKLLEVSKNIIDVHMGSREKCYIYFRAHDRTPLLIHESSEPIYGLHYDVYGVIEFYDGEFVTMKEIKKYIGEVPAMRGYSAGFHEQEWALPRNIKPFKRFHLIINFTSRASSWTQRFSFVWDGGPWAVTSDISEIVNGQPNVLQRFEYVI